ncbi:MAG: efflux RND transporter periplasmic adaptor subunit [Polyangia bacterium]
MKRFLFLILLCGCHREAQHHPVDQGGMRLVRFDPASLARLGVVVARAGDASARARIVVPGTLEYDLERYAEVGTPQEGRIVSVDVRVGDKVRKGQSLGSVLVPGVAGAQAHYLQARAALHADDEKQAREKGLLEKALTTASEAEAATAEAARSEASVQAARAQLEVMGAQIPEGSDAIQAGRLVLRSPLAGEVVRRDAVLGRYVQPDQIAFAVADASVLWATIEVFENDIPYFAVGTKVEVTVDAMPGRKIEGTVALMEPQLGASSRALRARIAVPNNDRSLRPGLFVRASTAIPESTVQGLLVPAAAVQPVGDDDVVFIARAPGTFEVRRVRVGQRDPQVVRVEEGLSRGEPIVVAGTFLLRSEVTKQ